MPALLLFKLIMVPVLIGSVSRTVVSGPLTGEASDRQKRSESSLSPEGGPIRALVLIRLTPPRTKGAWMASRRFRSRSDGLTGGASTGLWIEERLNQRSPAGRRVPLASAGGWWSKPDKQKARFRGSEKK